MATVNRKSQWQVTTFDLVCGGLSVLGLLLWIITREGDLAILFSLLADGLAAFPTIVKTFKYPETESGWTYFTAGISGLLTLLTIDTWTFSYFGFPLYIFLVNILIAGLAQFKIGKRFF